jgi:hypothetical protein
MNCDFVFLISDFSFHIRDMLYGKYEMRNRK